MVTTSTTLDFLCVHVYIGRLASKPRRSGLDWKLGCVRPYWSGELSRRMKPLAVQVTGASARVFLEAMLAFNGLGCSRDMPSVTRPWVLGINPLFLDATQVDLDMGFDCVCM